MHYESEIAMMNRCTWLSVMVLPKPISKDRNEKVSVNYIQQPLLPESAITFQKNNTTGPEHYSFSSKQNKLEIVYVA